MSNNTKAIIVGCVLLILTVMMDIVLPFEVETLPSVLYEELSELFK